MELVTITNDEYKSMDKHLPSVVPSLESTVESIQSRNFKALLVDPLFIVLISAFILIIVWVAFCLTDPSDVKRKLSPFNVVSL